MELCCAPTTNDIRVFQDVHVIPNDLFGSNLQWLQRSWVGRGLVVGRGQGRLLAEPSVVLSRYIQHPGKHDYAAENKICRGTF